MHVCVCVCVCARACVCARVCVCVHAFACVHVSVGMRDGRKACAAQPRGHQPSSSPAPHFTACWYENDYHGWVLSVDFDAK